MLLRFAWARSRYEFVGLLIFMIGVISFVPVRAWDINRLSAEMTIISPDLLDPVVDPPMAKTVGWRLSVGRTQNRPLVSPTIQIQDQVFAFEGQLNPGETVTVLSTGEVKWSAGTGLKVTTELRPVALDIAKPATVKLSAESGHPPFDFRLLWPGEIGWQLPYPSFEAASQWRGRNETNGVRIEVTQSDSYTGRSCLRIQGENDESIGVAKSAYIPMVPTAIGLPEGSGVGTLAFSVRVKAVDVSWPASMDRHGGGPRLTMRYYDANRKYLYQNVITNANSANPLIKGTTDGWVEMRGLKCFRAFVLRTMRLSILPVQV